MKRINRILLGLLIVTLVGLSTTVLAQEGGVFTLPASMQIIEEEAFMGVQGVYRVVVPEGTTRIGRRAFANSSVTRVLLPESLEYIAKDAFEGCDGLTVVAGKGTYAYEWAAAEGYITPDVAPEESFTTKTLADGTLSITGYTGTDTAIAIPAKIGGVQVTKIGERAFQNNSSITSVVIPEGVTEIGNYAFGVSKSELASVVLPSTLKELGEGAFYGTKLTEIELPDGLVTIGACAFVGTGLTEAYIPASVISIDFSAFGECDTLTDITVAEGNAAYKSVNGVLFTADGRTLVQYPAGKAGAEYVVPEGVTELFRCAFYGNEYLTSIELPKGLTTMGRMAVSFCTSLENITLPASCTDIGRNALMSNPKLKGIVVPEGVETIEWGTFADCTGLTSVTLPQSLTMIDGSGFSGCSALTEIVLPEKIETINVFAFSGCGSLEKINLPKSITFIEIDAFEECDQLIATVDAGSYAHNWCLSNSVEVNVIGEEDLTPNPETDFTYTIADGEATVTGYIGESTRVVIPETLSGAPVTEIGERAFENNTSINRVIIPEGVTVIGQYAFSWCEQLMYAELPSTIRKIEEGAFEFCRLGNTDLPEGLTHIGEWAFSSNGMKAVYIPASVVSIGREAFFQCPIEAFTVAEDNPSYKAEDGILFTKDGKSLIFYPRTKEDETYKVPEGVISIESNAFKWSALKTIELPDSLKTIGDGAFTASWSLESVHIPAGVTSIGHDIFNFCHKLKTVTVAESSQSYKAVDNVLFSKDGSKLMFYLPNKTESEYTVPAGVKEIAGYAFEEAENLQTVILPDTLETIGTWAFSDCTGLQSVSIPSCVTIDDRVFSGCSSLTEITLPEGLEYIGWGAFQDCTSLKNVVLPEGILTIDGRAFQYCSALETITLPESISYISDDAFEGCGKFTATVVDGSYAHTWCVDNGFEVVVTEPDMTPNPESDFTYTIADGKATVTGYTGTKARVIIPATLGGAQVTEIGENAFRDNRNITMVVIPEGVMEIGQYAFKYCNYLKNVQLPSTLKEIDYGAFDNCAIAAINLPEGLTAIAEWAFNGNDQLTEVYIPASVTSIGDRAFYQCSRMTAYTVAEGNPTYKAADGVLFSKDGKRLLVYPQGNAATEYVVPDGVMEIGLSAFNQAGNLTKITLPDSLTSISSEGFRACRMLTTIHIPAGVTAIGNGAFDYCNSLESITLSAENTAFTIADGALISPDGTTLQAYPAARAAAEYTVPDGITAISFRAFLNAANLTKITLPESLKRIENGAFEDCAALTSINLPESIIYIASSVFRNCANVTAMVVEGSYAHTYCVNNNVAVNLVEPDMTPNPESDFTYTIADGKATVTGYTGTRARVIIPATLGGAQVTEIGKNAFEGNRNITMVVIPEGVTTIGDYAFRYCYNLKTAVLPTTLTTIGDYAFDCCALKELVLPDSLTAIGVWAFNGNTSLTEVTIPAGVISMGNDPFCQCYALTTYTVAQGNTAYKAVDGVLFTADGKTLIAYPMGKAGTTYTVPAGVTAIGERAFIWMEKLTSIALPDSLQRIGNEAFRFCASLESIAIPDGCTSIGANAFDSCSSLTGVVLPEGVTQIADNAFYGCTSLTGISIPENCTSIGPNAFDRCSSLAGEIVIPAGVTIIGYRTFAECTSLTGVVLPEGVMQIAVNAFYGCTSLTSINLPESITTIYSNAFQNCENVTATVVDGSYAHEWCVENNVAVNVVKPTAEPNPTPTPEACKHEKMQMMGMKVQKETLLGSEENGHWVYQEGISNMMCQSCKVMFQNKFSREMLIDHNYEGSEDGSCVVCKYMPAPVYSTEDGLQYTVNDAQECRIVGHEGEPVTLEIPEEIEGKAVTSIKDNAFIGCLSLETLVIPGSVKEVGEWAFHGCENLSSVTLEYGIETLNSDVFSGCPLLTEIVLPDSITTMRNGVFSRCYGLESVTLSKGLTVLDEGIFWENTSLKSIEIPDGVMTIVDNCFIWSGLESITIPASVESIAESAFAGCESLATVYTPSGSYAEEFFAEYYPAVECTAIAAQ